MKDAEHKVPGERPQIEVGDDGQARAEKDMGLAIDPATGRAYESQGDFQNLGLGAGGKFRNGRALPMAFKCTGCDVIVIENYWAGGFQNCGSIICGALRFEAEFYLCRECVSKVLSQFPSIRATLAAMHGGDLKRG